MKKEIDTYSDNELICPYCGHKNDIADGMFLEDCEEDVECEKCGRSFIAKEHRKCTYETQKKKRIYL